jgi:HEAT repeat protein
MKRIIITILVILIGMTVFAQSADMSYYTDEFNRATATFVSRLRILENVRDANMSDIGEFYHSALKTLLAKIPDIKTREDRDASETSARMICQALAAEKYAAAATDLWQLAQYSDIIRDTNDGLTMQEALVALGQTGDKTFVPHIVQTLDDLNTQLTSDLETRRRIQRAAAGSISALEALHDIEGYRPVFFVYVGGYDLPIRNMAYDALPNIVDDPGDVIISIIRNSSNNPSVKLRAWDEMLRTDAPNSSKAKVAAVALDLGWNYQTYDLALQRDAKSMRMSAIDAISSFGAADDSVYINLDKSYSNNFVNNIPDYDEIRKTINALAVLKTDNAVMLLYNYLRELNDRRRSGVWGNKERQMMQLIVPALGATGTQSDDVKQLLTTITNSQDYTGTEQSWARDALRRIGN